MEKIHVFCNFSKSKMSNKNKTSIYKHFPTNFKS